MPANTRLAVPVPQLGIDKSQAAWVIDAQHCVLARDLLFDQIGYARRRGPNALASGPPSLTYASPGITQVSNPQGAHRVAAMQGDGGSNKLLSFLTATTYAAVVSSFTWPHAISRSTIFVDAPAKKRGTFIGTSDRYDGAATVQALALWRGAINTDTDGGVTITATRGSKTVTGSGSFSSAVTPGAHLFAEASTVTGTPTTFIGVVQSIVTSTVTLEEPALASVTAGKTPSFKAVRGVNPRVSTGTLTCAAASTTVNGGATRFKSQGLGTGTWQIFRARDLTFVGEVSTVTSNIQLVLGAGAAIAMDNELYIAIQMDGDYTISTTSSNWAKKLGFLTCAYAERQWYANSWRTGDAGDYQYRLWYSSVLDGEAVDLSEDGGSWIPINSTSGYNYPIIGLYPTYAGIIIAKQNEVLLLTGDDPSNFSVRQLLGTDGALGPRTFVQHEGGAIWAGRRGIYEFDGVSVNDVSAALGDGYQAQMVSFNPETYRAYGFKHRNHYHLSIESTTGEAYYSTVASNGDLNDDILIDDTDLRNYLTFDEDLSVVGPQFPVSDNVPGWGNLCPPSRKGGSVYGRDNTSVSGASFATSTDVPAALAADLSTKRYWFGPMNASNSTAGSATTVLPIDKMRLQKIALEHAGVIKQAKVALDGAGTGSGSQVCKAVIYSDSSGAATLLATSDEVTVTDGQAFGYVTFTFSGGETIPEGQCWVGLHGGGNTNTIRIAIGGYVNSHESVLSLTDTYSGGAASTYVGNGTTGVQVIAIAIGIDAAPTPRSLDLSLLPAPQYPDPGTITDYPRLYTGTSQTGSVNYAHIDLGSAFTMGAWVKITTLPDGTTNSVFAGIGGYSAGEVGAGNDGFGLWYGSDGTVYFQRIGANGGLSPAGTSDTTVSTAAGTVTTGTWYHIVGVADGATLKIYINGVLAATNLVAVLDTTLYGYMYWGMNTRDVGIAGQVNYHRGLLHRCFYIQRALTTTEIFNLSNPSAEGEVTNITTATTLTQQTYVLNLYSGAWSTWTNFMHRGAINPPAETGKKTWAILTNSADVAKFIEVEAMYATTGNADAVQSETSTQKGPRLFLEYRRSGVGDATVLAYWKELIVKAKAVADGLFVMAVPDLDGTNGYTLGDEIPADTDFDPPHRIRISRRNTHMGIRIYEEVAGTTLTDAKIGPADLVWKPLRHGRDSHAA